LSEALRVTQSGSTFGFTVWGRKANIQYHDILDDVYVKHDLKPKVPPKKTNYDLGKDPAGMKAELLSMGFANVHVWYQHMNFNFKDADEYVDSFLESVTAKAMLSKCSEEQRQSVREDMKVEFAKRMGPEVLDQNSFEVMIITAVKP
jgi:hypothetical protein